LPACADRQVGRRHRPYLRPICAPAARPRRWQARARGRGAAADLMAAARPAARHQSPLQVEGHQPVEDHQVEEGRRHQRR
jgi:hypothetical protein